jgi:hypothetical protein
LGKPEPVPQIVGIGPGGGRQQSVEFLPVNFDDADGLPNQPGERRAMTVRD